MAAHECIRFNTDKNTVSGNRTRDEHVEYVINQVAGKLMEKTASLDIIGVSEGAMALIEFFNKPSNFYKWERRIGAMGLLAPWHSKDQITNLNFRAWLAVVSWAFSTI